jgi:hypothetical protein
MNGLFDYIQQLQGQLPPQAMSGIQNALQNLPQGLPQQAMGQPPMGQPGMPPQAGGQPNPMSAIPQGNPMGQGMQQQLMAQLAGQGRIPQGLPPQAMRGMPAVPPGLAGLVNMPGRFGR